MIYSSPKSKILSSNGEVQTLAQKVLLSTSFHVDKNVDLLKVSLAEKQGQGKEKKRERLVTLGMLFNNDELSSLASIFKMTGFLSTVSSKLKSVIVQPTTQATKYYKSLSLLFLLPFLP